MFPSVVVFLPDGGSCNVHGMQASKQTFGVDVVWRSCCAAAMQAQASCIQHAHHAVAMRMEAAGHHACGLGVLSQCTGLHGLVYG